MSISSAMCHAQETAQRERAEQATLENVRALAITAAEAWRKEGFSAQAREQRDRARLNRAKFANALDRSA